MRKLLPFLLLFGLWAGTAQAQQVQCATRPAGDSSNACASTAFVNGGSGNILPVPAGGTGQSSFTANLPLIGNGTSAIAQGTVSGSTTAFSTVDGAVTNGHCVQFDSAGGLVDAGNACGSGGGGSGTVSAGLAGQPAYYPSAGTAVAGLSLTNTFGKPLSSAGVGGAPQFTGPINAIGMKCDGTTDDTAALQSNITNAAGAWLILPAGVCIISGTVASLAPIHISGQGAGSGAGVTRLSPLATVIKSTSGFTGGDMFQCVTVFECVIDHIQFNATTARTGNSSAIKIIGMDTSGETSTSTLTTNGTTSSGAVLHFASVSGVPNNACVYDATNPNAINNGEIVSSQTGTTITLNSNVDGTVGSGDLIYFQGFSSCTSTNQYSVLNDIAFFNQYTDIWNIRVGLIEIEHTFHSAWTRAGLYEVTTACCELGGGKIHDNDFEDLTPGTPTSCIEMHGGYFDIYSNHILGCQIGISMACDTFDCGSPKIENNVIENSTVKAIDIDATGGYSISMLNIHDNEISNAAFTSGLQAEISIDAFSGGGVLQDVQIHDNVIRTAFTPSASSCINIQQNALPLGTQFSGNISHNVCQNLTNNANGYGIAMGSSAIGYVLNDNQFPEFVLANWYLLQGTANIVIDHIGLPFANLPTPANGSQIYVTNGAPGSSPCSGSSSGSMAFRQGSGWKCF